MFQSLRSEPFDIHAHLHWCWTSLIPIRGLLASCSWTHVNGGGMEPHFLVYSQFMARVADLIGRSKIQRSLKDLRWRRGNHADDVPNDRCWRICTIPRQYGPIMRLTSPKPRITLRRLNESTVEDEEQIWLLNYEKRLYERNLELIDEMEEGSLNLLFLHEGWLHEHGVPFAVLHRCEWLMIWGV